MSEPTPQGTITPDPAPIESTEGTTPEAQSAQATTEEVSRSRMQVILVARWQKIEDCVGDFRIGLHNSNLDLARIRDQREFSHAIQGMTYAFQQAIHTLQMIQCGLVPVDAEEQKVQPVARLVGTDGSPLRA